MPITTTSLSEQERMNKKSFHNRNDSGELDVFEAARYFSGSMNEACGGNSLNYTHKFMIREQSYKSQQGPRRMSLDMPNIPRNTIPSIEKPTPVEKKSYKQPSSPGGKLASFLNSLFNQTSSSSKKKKPKPAKMQSMKEEEESPNGRRKRRSSMSYFRSSGNNNVSVLSDAKSMYSTSSSGFRTPPPCTPTIPAAKNLRSFSDHKPTDHKPVMITTHLSKVQVPQKQQEPIVKEMVFEEKNSIKGQDFSWLDENFEFKNMKKNDFGNGFLEKGRIWGSSGHHHKFVAEERDEFKKFSDDEDEGGDSDSSSDLFELTNCDLGYYSSGLPVYETTHMDSIKRGAPISSGS